MCEPMHSIVQFPSQPLVVGTEDSRFETTTQDAINALKPAVRALAKRLGDWVHFSAPGNGHTGAIELSGAVSLLLPAHIRYDAHWPTRSCKRDTIQLPSVLPSVLRATLVADAEAQAIRYDRLTVTGEMQKFRQWLEASLRATSSLDSYLELFLSQMLTVRAGNQLSADFRKFFGLNTRNLRKSLAQQPNTVIGGLIRRVIGYTRRRENLNSNWADDDQLWR